jgi:hypothetical protein
VLLRTGKPQAPTTLPSLGNRTSNDHPLAGPRSPGASTRRSRAPMPPVDPMTAKFSMDMQLPSGVLPQRRTGRGFTAVPQAAAWPLIVIALSVLAILLSIGALAA